jgi:hypothetical protein
MRRQSQKDKELADNTRLLRWWSAWHREQRDEALAKYPSLVELFRLFRNLQHAQPVQVLGLAAAIDWSVIDYATRLTVLHEFNTRVTAFREKRGLEPIDDGVGAPGEPETPFRQLKTLLFPPNGAPTGA